MSSTFIGPRGLDKDRAGSGGLPTDTYTTHLVGQNPNHSPHDETAALNELSSLMLTSPGRSAQKA